ncbi:unnamed protein product [Strongylus vulgaris]|uniref:Uncharacterized protein n=1 Tax=Strongylus vulgaris TaxID=40348 RepID=A0A3P7JA02_STRVU|nr:unnamed protein product [Strongylus vulgaris]
MRSSCLHDPAEYVSKAKHRWAGHIMRTDNRWTLRGLKRIPHEAKRRHRPDELTLVARMDQLKSQLIRNNDRREHRCGNAMPASWMTLARSRNGWRNCCGLTSEDAV